MMRHDETSATRTTPSRPPTARRCPSGENANPSVPFTTALVVAHSLCTGIALTGGAAPRLLGSDVANSNAAVKNTIRRLSDNIGTIITSRRLAPARIESISEIYGRQIESIRSVQRCKRDPPEIHRAAPAGALEAPG